jgi:hypothetical protein
VSEPDLTAELDAAEEIVMGRTESVVTEWASRDSSGSLFAYGHDEFVARSVVASRERYGIHDVLVRRTVTYGPWEEVRVPEQIGEAS